MPVAQEFFTNGKDKAEALLDSLVSKYRSPAGIISKEGGFLYLDYAHLLFVTGNTLEGIGFLNRARDILESEELTEEQKIKLQNIITASYLAQGFKDGDYSLIDDPDKDELLSNAIIVHFLGDKSECSNLLSDSKRLSQQKNFLLLPTLLHLAEAGEDGFCEQVLSFLEGFSPGTLSERITSLRNRLDGQLKFAKQTLTEIERLLIEKKPKDALSKSKALLEEKIFGITRIEALRLKGDSELELEKLDDAYETFAEAYQRVKNEQINDELLIADVTHNYALLEAERGNNKIALAMLNEALKLKIELFGFDHELTQKTKAAIEALTKETEAPPAASVTKEKVSPRELAIEIKKHLEEDELKFAKKKLDDLIKIL